jgi:amidohydrolase
MAIKDQDTGLPYTLEVIGTPAEETVGGKVLMLEHGAFQDLDVALMMHGNDVTQVDLKSLALTEFLLTFHGISAHAGMAPEDGRSALEALMLVFNGLAFLRGHVKDDTRIHGIIEQGGAVVNAIPDHAVARLEVRSYDRSYLDRVIERVQRIIEGAALMTLEKTTEFHGKIPVRRLNDLVMRNAERAGAKDIEPPRERTGSTDFGNVMYHVPGTCINLPFVDKGISAHTQGYLDRGKSPEAHEAVAMGARILAMTVLDLLNDPSLLDAVKADFRQEKARLTGSPEGL